MPQKLFFSGNTLQQALLAAARHFHLEPEEIAFRPREKRHGFVKRAGKVVIEVDPQAPRRGPQASGSGPAEAVLPPPPRAEPSPAPRRDPARPEATGPSAAAAREALGDLLSLGDLDLDAAIYPAADGFEVELDGPDADLVLAENGALLHALEHLLRRALRGALGEGAACRIDARGFRRSHEARLEQMARAAAEEVRRSGAPQRLPRMDPADRRLIHLALAEEPGVTTQSDGEGLLKTVVVHPA